MSVPVFKNQQLTLTCDAVNENGDGVCRTPEGFVVFCRGLLPGESAAMRIIKVTSGYAVARAIGDPDNISPIRRAPACPYAAKGCGGRAFPHITPEGQAKLARARVVDCLARIGVFPEAEIDAFTEPCAAPEPSGPQYRNKTVYPFFCVDGELRTGFYARASHRPVAFLPGTPCMHENPVAARARETILNAAKELGYTAYDETSAAGLLRHLTLRISDHSGKIMAVITATRAALPEEKRFIDRVAAALPELDSLWLNINRNAGNTILGPDFRLLYGSPALECRLRTAVFRISPASFFQVSTAGAELLYDTVAEFAGLSGGENVLDLYCGAGTIGLYLANDFRDKAPDAFTRDPILLTGIEIVPDAVDNARRNAILNSVSGCRFIAGDVPAVIGELPPGSPDLVIIDPPRKGTDNTLIAALRRLSPARIIYVSCNPATLSRDLKELCADGNYRLVRIRPVNMFPDTGHVETVTLITRAGLTDRTDGESGIHISGT
ncbi:MAG: 23S rRNA (uracil(1939)-C(5))-methyltransferase RlmD [Clostridia bacterium]|nr:23S rRNA (uracil(1939)-C(5))-methyltransferase RlmD [Clostridia bacterium]